MGISKRNRRIFYLTPMVLFFGLGTTVALLSKPLPEGTASEEADRLAHAMEDAIHTDAWDQLEAVSWTFMGKHHHLWDKRRNYAEVRWGRARQERVVRLDLGERGRALVWRGGKLLTGKKADKLVEEAYSHWCNDAYWLNPLAKLFDSGTTRKVVDAVEGHRRLLLTYTGGGVTPGDSYLYTLGQDNLPIFWEMWVSIIPIGGLKVSFEGWTTLPGGAIISTSHALGPMKLELTDIKAGPLLELAGSDVFTALDQAYPRE